MATAIELTSVTKQFGDRTAVDDVSLRVGQGEVLALVGHNGAGKSTLFRMMLGIIEPSSGTIRFDAGGVAGSPADRRVRRAIGFLPESVALWSNLDAIETLHFLAGLKGGDASGCERLLEQVGLADARRRPVREYSKGMRQRLGLAQALLGSPRIVFLDEPTSGLDPAAVHQFWATVDELRGAGTTVVMSSHSLAEMERRVDRVAMLANGRLRALGTIDELRMAHALPVTVTLRWHGGAVSPLGGACRVDALLEQLEASGTLAHDGASITPDGLALRIRPRDKLRVLGQVMALLGDTVADVRLDEATLEDVYLHLGGEGAGR